MSDRDTKIAIVAFVAVITFILIVAFWGYFHDRWDYY